MSIRKMMGFCMVMVFFFLATDTIAQENLTCADIEWLPVVTNEYPNIADACVGVVEKNGKIMAKVRVEVVSARSGAASFRFSPSGWHSQRRLPNRTRVRLGCHTRWQESASAGPNPWAAAECLSAE